VPPAVFESPALATADANTISRFTFLSPFVPWTCVRGALRKGVSRSAVECCIRGWGAVGPQRRLRKWSPSCRQGQRGSRDSCDGLHWREACSSCGGHRGRDDPRLLLDSVFSLALGLRSFLLASLLSTLAFLAKSIIPSLMHPRRRRHLPALLR
jgi:hypothetical protein